VMGCVLALTFQRTRSLFASMLLHGANNGLAIVALLVTLKR
jgi:membrane protease YdiL (CAAX protease family)